MPKTIFPAILAALVLGPAGVAAQSMTEQPIILGKASYNANCVDCHGADAKGKGPYAEFLTVQPADLTALSRNAGGAFPFATVYKVIQGEKEVRTHKMSAMPVWGEEFRADTLVDHGLAKEDAQNIVQGRILALVYYLQSIQQ